MAELIINRIEEGLFTHTLTVDGTTQTAIDNAPNLTSFWENGIRVLHFKTKNGAPLIKNQRILPSEITITDSFGGTPPQTGFTNDVEVWMALGELGYFEGFAGGSGGGGVSSFINLTDVSPNLYLGFGGMVYIVNEEETGLTPETFYNYHLLTQNDDVSALPITSNDVGKVLAVQMDGTNPKFMLTDLPQNGVIIPNGFTDLGEQTLVDGEYTATVGYEWNYSNIHYGLIEDYTTAIDEETTGNSRIDVIHTIAGTNDFTKTVGEPSAGEGTALKPQIPVGSLEVTQINIYEDNISEPVQPPIGNSADLDDVLGAGNTSDKTIVLTGVHPYAIDVESSTRTQGFSYANTFQGTRVKFGGNTDDPELTAAPDKVITNAKITGTEYFPKENIEDFVQLGDVAGVNETTGIFANIQPLIDSAPKGVTVNLLKGANYDDQDNALVLKEGSVLNLNGATLKRVSEQIVLTMVSANQESTSITVDSVPTGWKVGDYLQLFTDNTFNTASRKYEAIIESIVGNLITFTGALKPAYGTTYTWGIGTKVRKVFSQITAPRSYDLFTQPTKWLVYNGTIDGNKDENSGNLYWGANMGVANNGRAGLLAVDIINQPNEAVMGSGFSINLCNIDSVNGSFIHYTADINVGESILGGEISNNIVSNTNIADSETVTGHSEAVITFSYTSGRSNVNNNRFLGGGGKVLGTVSYASESEDGSLQEFYFNNNYCKGYEGIINNFVYNGSAIRVPDNVIISENIFEDCGVNDWNPYGSNINNYGKFKFDNNLLNGTTTLKGVPNKMLFDRKILQTIEWNNSTSPTLFFREFRDIKALTSTENKNLIRVSFPLSTANIFSFKLELDEYEQDGVATNKRTLSEISLSGIKLNTALGWNTSVLAENSQRFTLVKTGLNTAGDRMVAYIYLNGSSSIKDITLSNLKLKNANSDQALLLEDSENYGLTLETSESDFTSSFTVNRADFIGYQPDIVSNTNSSASTLSLITPARTNYYQHTGTGASWTLPDATLNVMNRIVCTHKGTGVLTINSLPNQIWESGVPVSTYVVAIGESVNFYPDGVNWIVL